MSHNESMPNVMNDYLTQNNTAGYVRGQTNLTMPDIGDEDFAVTTDMIQIPHKAPTKSNIAVITQ